MRSSGCAMAIPRCGKGVGPCRTLAARALSVDDPAVRWARAGAWTRQANISGSERRFSAYREKDHSDSCFALFPLCNAILFLALRSLPLPCSVSVVEIRWRAPNRSPRTTTSGPRGDDCMESNNVSHRTGIPSTCQWITDIGTVGACCLIAIICSSCATVSVNTVEGTITARGLIGVTKTLPLSAVAVTARGAGYLSTSSGVAIGAFSSTQVFLPDSSECTVVIVDASADALEDLQETLHDAGHELSSICVFNRER